jgi:hypothetical protein
MFKPIFMGGKPKVQEPRATLVIQRLAPRIPTIRAYLAQPEFQHFHWVRHWQHSLEPA